MSGTSQPPQGYIDTIKELERALKRWLELHPDAELRFNWQPEGVAMIATLGSVVDLISITADARALLTYMDAESKGEGTYLMVEALLRRRVDEHNADRVPASACPSCGHKMDAATGINAKKARPKPGDVGFCIQCGAANTYGDDLKLRAMTADEEQTLPDNIKAIIEKARAHVRSRGARTN